MMCLPARGGKRMAIKPRKMSDEHMFDLFVAENLCEAFSSVGRWTKKKTKKSLRKRREREGDRQ